MKTKTLLAAGLVAGALISAGTANAANLVTLNPQANNNGIGVISPTNGAFQTLGAQANLTSVLTINGNTGVQGFSETGQIRITSFQDGTGFVPSGVDKASGGNYDIFGNFSLTGTGFYLTPNIFFTSNIATFSVNLFAVSSTNQTIQLGTANVIASLTNNASATLGAAPVPGGSGQASTTLTALLDFAPAPGTTGVNGFFQAPTPFLINIGVGNAGGNPLNTTYSVNGSGVVTVTTSGVGVNPGTANITFATNAVPEPGALSLAGLALLGAAVATRRRKAVAV